MAAEITLGPTGVIAQLFCINISNGYYVCDLFDAQHLLATILSVVVDTLYGHLFVQPVEDALQGCQGGDLVDVDRDNDFSKGEKRKERTKVEVMFVDISLFYFLTCSFRSSRSFRCAFHRRRKGHSIADQRLAQ